MFSLTDPAYYTPLLSVGDDIPADKLSRVAPMGDEIIDPPSPGATISHLQSFCAPTENVQDLTIFSAGKEEKPDDEENAILRRQQDQLSNVLAFWQIDIGPSAFQGLCARRSIEVFAWYLMDFKDQCDFHWPENDYPGLIDSRRKQVRNILDTAAVDEIFYKNIIDILMSRPQACIDDCDLKLAEISFLLAAGRLESVEDGARAAFRQGCMTCAARLALQEDPGPESLESFALVNFYLQKLLDSCEGPIDRGLMTEPQCSGGATISHGRARNIAGKALRHEQENDYPYTRGAIVTSPGVKDALQKCLYKHDAGYRQSISMLQQQYEFGTAGLDLSGAQDIRKAHVLLCDRNEKLAEAATSRFLAALKKSHGVAGVPPPQSDN